LLCDGEWHTIQATKTANTVILMVDANTEYAMGVGGVTSTDTMDPLYVGGVPPEDRGKPGIGTTENFVGCIRNLLISGRTVPMAGVTVYGPVNLSTCPTI